MKIKLLKDYHAWKKGEIHDTSEFAAAWFLRYGIAEKFTTHEKTNKVDSKPHKKGSTGAGKKTGRGTDKA